MFPGRLTIAIPTILRAKENYFLEMFASMVNKTTPQQLQELLFVVFLADFNNTQWKVDLRNTLYKEYEQLNKSGSLLVVDAPFSFYSKMNKSLTDQYVYWRTKQNYDYAFLMDFCAGLSSFYMQMEDDVVPTDNYITAITDFVDAQKDDNWVCLEFSKLGFIGKLYHDRDLKNLAQMLLIFSDSQPVDFTNQYFNVLTGRRSELRIPTLFQHLGIHSSLNHKIQPLKDVYFNVPDKEFRGDNPAAVVTSSLEHTDLLSPDKAYSRQPGYFWSRRNAVRGDVVTITFKTPQNITRVVITTGNDDHPTDTVQHGILEAATGYSTPENSDACGAFTEVSPFHDGHVYIEAHALASTLNSSTVACLQIRFTDNQDEWVIIREIAVFVG